MKNKILRYFPNFFEIEIFDQEVYKFDSLEDIEFLKTWRTSIGFQGFYIKRKNLFARITLNNQSIDWLVGYIDEPDLVSKNELIEE